MNPSSSETMDSGPLTGESTVEVVYQSTATRVYRRQGEDGAVICKEALDAHARRRLEHEKDMLMRVCAVPGVSRLADTTPSSNHLVLEDHGGISLAHLLQAGPCGLATLVALAPRLAGIVAGVHRAGVIHRDINPANIMLAQPGLAPVLIDFDLALPVGQHDEPGHQDGIVGTLAYLAPEQTGRTGRKVDQRADLYALGATFYEMATGRPPFDETDTLHLIHAHMVREPVAPAQVTAGIPRALSNIILRLLAKEPEQRYQSAEGLLHDLVLLQDELGQGRDADFALGEHDFAARLAPPRQIVGREVELALLHNALEAARRSSRRAVLIQGNPGVGKSALINELKPQVAEQGGWFVYGKFDQYQRDAAASATIQALRALGRLLLAAAPDVLAVHRERILEKLGRDASLFTGLLPEFALILGAQPDAPVADPGQAELRVQQAMVDVLSAIASPQRPLVIVLDDLQWAGGLSLRFFERLMNAPQPRGVLLVGAFRAGDIEPTHALSSMLARWDAQDEPPLRLALDNLAVEGTSELVGRMLRLPRARADELAHAMGALTGGNPFDTVEMINAMRHEGTLRLDERGWQWDTAAIRHFVGQGDVVDLLAARIARLPAVSRSLLDYMSCLGGSVDHALLQAVADLDPAGLRERLAEPLEDGLVVRDQYGQDMVHFRHDRVQQAVLGQLDTARRDQLQLTLARKLVSRPEFANYAAQQYLGCMHRLEEPDEKRDVSRLFHDTASKLARTANYALAERYLAAAAALLAPLDAAEDRPSLDQVAVERHAALYSLGRLDEADVVYKTVDARACDPLDMVDPACIQIRCLFMRGRPKDVVALGIDLLKRLGIAVPEDNSDAQTQARMDTLCQWAGQQIDAQPALAVNRRAQGIAKLASRLLWSTFLVDIRMSIWLLLECRRLWIEHGPGPSLVPCLARMSSILIRARQDYRTGFEGTRNLLAAGQARGFEPETSEARQIFTITASHWFETLEVAVQHAMRAREGLLHAGEWSYACYTFRSSLQVLMDLGPTLDNCVAEIDAGQELGTRTGNLHFLVLHQCDRQLLRALLGQTHAPGSFDDEHFEEQAYLRTHQAVHFAQASFHIRRGLSAALFNDMEALARNSARAMPLLEGIAGEYLTAHAYLLRALALAWHLQASFPGHDTAAEIELERCHQWLASRAADQPHNFQHLLLLVRAEQAWAQGDAARAAGAFDAALREAATCQRPWHAALITERAARFHVSSGWTHTAQLLMASARDRYLAWGALGKVRVLELEYGLLPAAPLPAASSHRARVPTSLGQHSSSVSTDALDLMGVLRASQALSSETSLANLTTRVCDVLASLTGATAVSVAAWSDGQWWLLAPATDRQTRTLRSVPLSQAAAEGLLPLSAFRYAELTREPLLVDNAASDDRFARDSYFAGLAICSMLVVPIASRGAPLAMLLLENRQGRAAFSAQRLDAVMLIAGQLAVSLANVQLYESLEQRVQARTTELQEAQAQLVTSARQAGMAEIANNVLHNVGNVLNSVNISAGLINEKMRDSKARALTRAVALMKEHTGDLGQFLSQDAKGKLLPHYLSKAVAALDAEQQEVIAELDSLTRSITHIKDIVAMQQSYAGASSMVEPVRIPELLDDAIRINAGLIERNHITVARDIAEVPTLLLDKPRLLQILVNLIANAAQAMHGVPHDSRWITLRASTVAGEEGAHLRICVQDEGEGILPENLSRIFAHGFTTKKNGHGFGLHSCALAAREMGGALTAYSEGAGHGAAFTLELPARPVTVQVHSSPAWRPAA